MSVRTESTALVSADAQEASDLDNHLPRHLLAPYKGRITKIVKVVLFLQLVLALSFLGVAIATKVIYESTEYYSTEYYTIISTHPVWSGVVATAAALCGLGGWRWSMGEGQHLQGLRPFLIILWVLLSVAATAGMIVTLTLNADEIPVSYHYIGQQAEAERRMIQYRKDLDEWKKEEGKCATHSTSKTVWFIYSLVLK